MEDKDSSSGGEIVKAIVNARIYDFVDYIDNGYIIFDKSIIEVGHMRDFNKSMERIDGKGRIAIPGLVNFHTHLYSSLFRGLDMKTNPENFHQVLEEIWWKYDNYLKLEDIGLAAGMYCKDSLKSGVTALVDHHAGGEIQGSLHVIRNVIKGRFGMKGLVCFETSDRYDVDECINENVDAIKMGDGLFGLHASMTLSDETLDKCSEKLHHTPIHIHAAESMEDEEHSLRQYGISVIERLDRHQLLNKNSILAHCVNINEMEAEIICDKECIVALNPSSNMNNAVGLFDYDLFRRNSINVVAGTDGLGANVAKEWQNIYYVSKQAMNKPSGIGPDEIRYHIAKSYELFNQLADKKIGRFMTGYDADMLLIDYEPPTPMNEENAFGHVLFGLFDNLKPRDVFIEGEYKLKNYDLQVAFDINHEMVNRLWRRIGGNDES
jgi:cytosine/adenosine deaminase-related metal-dependent hydrolase